MKALLPTNITDKVYFYSLLYLAAVLPFQFTWLSPTIGIISLSIAWVFSLQFKEKFTALRNNTPLITIQMLFILSLLGMTYTQNPQEGWNDVIVKLPLLLFPLILGTIKPISEKRIRVLLLAFATTVTGAVLILLIRALSLFLTDGESYHFFHHNLVFYERVPVHYFSMYCNFSFFVMLYYLVKEYGFSGHGKKIFAFFSLAILLTALFCTAVRIQLFAFCVALSSFLLWYYSKRKRWKALILSLLGFFMLFTALVFIIPGSRKRIKETYLEWSVFQGLTKNKQTNHRVYLWQDGWEVIKENFWTGSGTGSANDLLYEKISTRDAVFWDGQKYYTLAKKKYNYHNAFLQHFATYGIVGFLLLFAVFAIPLAYLNRESGFLSFIFLTIAFIGFITESMLERQAGNMFFGFLFGLLIANQKPKKE